jgi:kynurenine formamidase
MNATAVSDLVLGLSSGAVEVVDLTQPLSEDTPVIALPEPYVNSPGLSRRELARYDARNPVARWDVLEFGEHTGTHMDSPVHWITGADGKDLASIDAHSWSAPPWSLTRVPRRRRTPATC